MTDKTFTTSEAAKKLGVAPSTLRYWESEMGNSIKIQRDDNGYRQYTHQDIKLLKQVKDYLYNQNYSIKQVREILNMEDSKREIAAAISGKKDERITSLLSILVDKIDDIEEGLEQVKDGQVNIKTEYRQTVKMLNMSLEERDRKLVKEIRKRLSNKRQNKKESLLTRLLPWKNKQS
ncbi:MAG: MerR family transcriptional regulator [Halanaerobiales bacterium]